MNFERQNFVENIYETSKSSDGTPLLNVDAQEISVYHFDKIKEWFCGEYRNGNLRSCDAYYEDAQRKDFQVIEFKNTQHQKLKGYWTEIAEKLTDTHLLLAETFWRGKKTADMGKKISVCVVYNDSGSKVSYSKGLAAISNSLNTMKPKQGDKTRKTKEVECFADEQEYDAAVQQITEKYKGNFYKEIEFKDKKDFYTDYIDAGYYQTL